MFALVHHLPPPPLPLADQGVLFVEASLSHLDTPTLVKTPLEEWSARRRDIYLTTHTPKKTDFPAAARLEPSNPTNERLQTLVLEQYIYIYIQNRPHSYIVLLLTSSINFEATCFDTNFGHHHYTKITYAIVHIDVSIVNSL